MTIKNQLKKLKENWLLILILVLVVTFLGVSNSITDVFNSANGGIYAKSFGGYAPETMMADSAILRAPEYYDQGFAPEVQDRQITTTASLTTEINKGKFNEQEIKFKSILLSTDSILLSENVQKSGIGRRIYLSGNYQIKVESDKYSAVVSQLKDLGDVLNFNENVQDITGTYTDLNTELAAERARLQRFKEMLVKAESVNDQIELTDRIFNIERTISYYEDSLKNVNNRVTYSTIYFSMQEKQSEYVNVVFVKLSQLIRNIVDSFNGLLSLIFWILPWGILAVLVWIGVRFVKNRK